MSTTKLMFRRTAVQAVRNPGVAFGQVLIPPILIGSIFAALFQSVEHLPHFPARSYLDWILPGTLFLTAVVGAGFTAAELLRDLETGYHDRIRLLANDARGLVIGRVAFEAPRVALVAIPVLLLALLRGAHNDGGVVGAIAVIALTAGFAVAWNGIFFLSAITTRNRAAVLGLQPLFFPIMLFSTWFGPLVLMPHWFEQIARFNPVTWYLNAVRSILAGHISWTDTAATIAFIVVLASVTYSLAIRAFDQIND